MHRRRLVLGPSSAVNTINPVDPRAISKQRKKHVKEMKVQQQLARATHKWEERLKEMALELDETRSVREECENGLVDFEEEVRSWKEEVREWKAEVSRLNCRV